jgi:hypothetical protein
MLESPAAAMAKRDDDWCKLCIFIRKLCIFITILISRAMTRRPHRALGISCAAQRRALLQRWRARQEMSERIENPGAWTLWSLERLESRTKELKKCDKIKDSLDESLLSWT